MANIDKKLAPHTGSFNLTEDGKQFLIDDCLPQSSDTAAVTKQKLSRLTTVVYILLDSLLPGEEGPVKF